MKSPKEVGSDFDAYAAQWRRENYGLEVGYRAGAMQRDASADNKVQRPGDEWGDVAPLRLAYRALLERFAASAGPLNVVEIGAGGGRSTAVMLEELGGRAGEYHIVDVSAGFVEVLRERIDHPLDIHIVDDVDLGGLPGNHFDVCLAQSSWSHISLYDQYRYLKALRRVLRPRGVVFVNGVFLLGLGNEWTWDRFRRRIYQIDHGTQGVFHEFTSVAATTEMLTRLRYEICCITSAGFVARRGSGNPTGAEPLAGAISFPFNPSPHDFLVTGRARRMVLPTVISGSNAVTADEAVPAPAASPARPPSWGSRLLGVGSPLRNSLKRVPGLRAAVLKGRVLRRRLRSATIAPS